MTRRHAIAAGGYSAGPDRDPSLAVALARLEACATWRDTAAAARALDSMATSPDGAWLLLQMAAAGLRALSTGTQRLPTGTVHPATEHTPTAILASSADLSAGTSERTRTTW